MAFLNLRPARGWRAPVQQGAAAAGPGRAAGVQRGCCRPRSAILAASAAAQATSAHPCRRRERPGNSCWLRSAHTAPGRAAARATACWAPLPAKRSATPASAATAVMTDVLPDLALLEVRVQYPGPSGSSAPHQLSPYTATTSWPGRSGSMGSSRGAMAVSRLNSADSGLSCGARRARAPVQGSPRTCLPDARHAI